jgi:23S rRNA pseudouridine1911/1915/1917 synthase
MVEPTDETPGQRWVVEATETGLRLDAFLVRREVFPSAAAARRAIAAGIVRVNDRAGKKGAHLQAGDAVGLEGAAADEAILVPSPELDLPVLYADDIVVAVDKPANLPSHPLRASDGPTVASALIAKYPECRDASPDAREGGLAHRLDVGTSGVLLAARDREAWYRLREALAQPSCEKTYLAEVHGPFPTSDDIPEPYVLPDSAPASFVVEAPIGRQGRRGATVVLAAGRNPLPARTAVRLLEARDGSALDEAKLARGRAHQVRAHLAYLRIPVLGDGVYGNSVDGTSLHLHAWAVSFVHPVTGKLMRIESPPPAWARPRA